MFNVKKLREKCSFTKLLKLAQSDEPGSKIALNKLIQITEEWDADVYNENSSTISLLQDLQDLKSFRETEEGKRLKESKISIATIEI